MTGVILAGGNGKRMGLNKACLFMNGNPVLLALAEIVAQIASEVIIAIGKKRDLGFSLPCHVKVVEDIFPGLGPLSGLYTALAHASFPFCLVVACDTPFLRPALLAHLVDNADRTRPVVFSVRGFLEPFPGLYPKSILPEVEEALRQGNLGVQDFLKSIPAKILGENEARLVDPSLSSFVNINTREDLQRCGG